MMWRTFLVVCLISGSALPLSACLSAAQELKLTDDIAEDDDGEEEEVEKLVDDTVGVENDAPQQKSASAKNENVENANIPEKPPAPKTAVPKAGVPPPSVRRGKGVYPFPKSFNIFEFDHFLKTNEGLYVRYMPLQKEYELYFKTINERDEVSDESLQALKKRVMENDEKAHWVWLYGINDLIHFMYDNSRQMLRVDLEENFAARMKVISYLASALKNVKKNAKYIEFSRAFYVSMNERYLGRQVKPRQDEPGGTPKRPDQAP